MANRQQASTLTVPHRFPTVPHRATLANRSWVRLGIAAEEAQGERVAGDEELVEGRRDVPVGHHKLVGFFRRQECCPAW